MGKSAFKSNPGPFHADQVHDGDRYELSGGHPIYCAPAGPEHAGRSLTGAAVIASDPDVEWAGVDAGFTPEPGTLRAPDLAVAAPASGRGWIPGAPLLAVEYASYGQDEADLQTKIGELLRGGSRFIWVVRLVGPRRVEVHRPNEAMQVFGSGDELHAPGILRNPVAVDALFDRAAADRATLRNLLQRAGYAGLDAVRDEGREAGREEGREAGLEEGREEGRVEGMTEAILALLAGRGVAVTPEVEARVRAGRDPNLFKTWLLAATRVTDPNRIFD
jgi:hypothetical protein